MRVVIADDHAEFRAALCDLLDADGRIEVVADVATGSQAVAAVRRLQPDVAILDVHMADNGVAAARRLASTAVKVLLLTAHDTPAIRQAAAAAGVSRLIDKGDGTDLAEAVLTAAGSDLGSPTSP